MALNNQTISKYVLTDRAKYSKMFDFAVCEKFSNYILIVEIYARYIGFVRCEAIKCV